MNEERKELNKEAKKRGGKSAKWIGLTGSFTNTGKYAKDKALAKMKKDIFKSRYGEHGMMQFSGPNAEKNKRKDIKYNYKKLKK